MYHSLVLDNKIVFIATNIKIETAGQ
jgi:hypothetical protein